MNEPCAHCPLAGTGTTCPRWPSNHTRYCEWVDPGSPGYRPDGSAALIRIAGAGTASFPPLLAQAKNLAGATVRFLASGLERTTKEERARRLSICRVCEHFEDGPPGRCRLCGCVSSWAARIASKRCPLEPPKW